MSLFSKFVDYSGLEHLWERITQRYDKKLDEVKGDDTIQVQDKDKLSVRISDKKDNLLSIDTGKGLYASRPVLSKLTFGAGKEYVYDGTEDVTVPVYDGSYHEN